MKVSVEPKDLSIKRHPGRNRLSGLVDSSVDIDGGVDLILRLAIERSSASGEMSGRSTYAWRFGFEHWDLVAVVKGVRLSLASLLSVRDVRRDANRFQKIKRVTRKKGKLFLELFDCVLVKHVFSEKM